jgi:hypothetical protein
MWGPHPDVQEGLHVPDCRWGCNGKPYTTPAQARHSTQLSRTHGHSATESSAAFTPACLQRPLQERLGTHPARSQLCCHTCNDCCRTRAGSLAPTLPNRTAHTSQHLPSIPPDKSQGQAQGVQGGHRPSQPQVHAAPAHKLCRLTQPAQCAVDAGPAHTTHAPAHKPRPFAHTACLRHGM